MVLQSCCFSTVLFHKSICALFNLLGGWFLEVFDGGYTHPASSFFGSLALLVPFPHDFAENYKIRGRGRAWEWTDLISPELEVTTIRSTNNKSYITETPRPTHPHPIEFMGAVFLPQGVVFSPQFSYSYQYLNPIAPSPVQQSFRRAWIPIQQYRINMYRYQHTAFISAFGSWRSATPADISNQSKLLK